MQFSIVSPIYKGEKYMKYNKEHCNIPGCNHRIYRNYMCKEHYDFYLTDDKCREISDDVIAVYEGKGSWKQKALAFRDNVIHHAFDYPMIPTSCQLLIR